jgi:hypothetical protein
MMGQQQQTVVGSTLFRRMVLALAIAAVMALLVMALAAPAFAVSGNGKGGERADLIGRQTSGVNQPDTPGYEPGKGGREVTADAAKPGAGPPGVGDIASTNHNTRP